MAKKAAVAMITICALVFLVGATIFFKGGHGWSAYLITTIAGCSGLLAIAVYEYAAEETEEEE